MVNLHEVFISCWRLHCLLPLAAKMKSSVTRRAFQWLLFLEHWRNVKEGIINGRASFQILVILHRGNWSVKYATEEYWLGEGNLNMSLGSIHPLGSSWLCKSLIPYRGVWYVKQQGNAMWELLHSKCLGPPTTFTFQEGEIAINNCRVL